MWTSLFKVFIGHEQNFINTPTSMISPPFKFNFPKKMIEINRSDIALVDFQYCHGNHKSIFVKELSFMCGASVVPDYFLFRPPFNIKELTGEACRTNAYTKTHVNGLDWTDGEKNYNDVEKALTPLNNYQYIFVVGQEKKIFLQKYIHSTIINLENNMKLRACQNYFTNCPIHLDTRFKCAVNNIFKIFVFIEQNWKELGYILDDEINKVNK